MKLILAVVSALVLRVASGSGHIHLISKKTSSEAPAPGTAAAPGGPAAGPPPGLEALHITFELENYNYYDLTKVTCPKKKKLGDAEEEGAVGNITKGKKFKSKVKGKKPGKADDASVNEALKEINGHADNIADQVADIGQPDGQAPKDAAGKPIKSALMQTGACAPMPDLVETHSKECTTVMDVLRSAITETIRHVIDCMHSQNIMKPLEEAIAGPSPGPAGALPTGMLPGGPAPAGGLVPLPPQPAFLQRVPSPAPAAAPAPGPAMSVVEVGEPSEEVKIFVTFSPGKEIPLALLQQPAAAVGATTIVDIAFLDNPANGVDDVAIAIPYVNAAIDNGFLKKQLRRALKKVTGIKPKIKSLAIETKTIPQYDIEKCEVHIKGIVKQFALHYTREQVPRALFNECTNFMTRMSFSTDHVLDPMDTMRCRKATAKFTKHWEYGENGENSDFEDMCLKACEAKYGRNAPTCNLHTGDKLVGQPLL